MKLQASSAQYLLNTAAGETMDQDAAIIEFAHGHARRSVIMRRAAPDPTVRPRSFYAVESQQQSVGTHRPTPLFRCAVRAGAAREPSFQIGAAVSHPAPNLDERDAITARRSPDAQRAGGKLQQIGGSFFVE